MRANFLPSDRYFSRAEHPCGHPFAPAQEVVSIHHCIVFANGAAAPVTPPVLPCTPKPPTRPAHLPSSCSCSSSSSRGRQNKIDGPPRAFAKFQTYLPTYLPADFFVDFFLVCFWAFLGKGSSKTPQTYFCKKSMSKTFSKTSDKNFDVSFSSIFFPFYRVSGCFSAMGVQKYYTKRSAKNRVEKSSQKIDNISVIVFSSIFLSRFWAFLGEGSSKTPF
jgi:hypothetical protein